MSKLNVDLGIARADASTSVQKAGEAFCRLGEAFRGVDVRPFVAGLGAAIRAAAEAERRALRRKEAKR